MYRIEWNIDLCMNLECTTFPRDIQDQCPCILRTFKALFPWSETPECSGSSGTSKSFSLPFQYIDITSPSPILSQNVRPGLGHQDKCPCFPRTFFQFQHICLIPQCPTFIGHSAQIVPPPECLLFPILCLT